eukprot:TRINITY_DN7053_c0_g1_i1.p1 TRINITY_DN7053_c0_g1~~TRINITY_DN7053_c0_g1_i1.p1  ORF type:complete len:692 (-),score=158.33 TRINITY_DN7053_c0_g1_i1:197-2179(-)
MAAAAHVAAAPQPPALGVQGERAAIEVLTQSILQWATHVLRNAANPPFAEILRMEGSLRRHFVAPLLDQSFFDAFMRAHRFLRHLTYTFAEEWERGQLVPCVQVEITRAALAKYSGQTAPSARPLAAPAAATAATPAASIVVSAGTSVAGNVSKASVSASTLVAHDSSCSSGSAGGRLLSQLAIPRDVHQTDVPQGRRASVQRRSAPLSATSPSASSSAGRQNCGQGGAGAGAGAAASFAGSGGGGAASTASVDAAAIAAATFARAADETARAASPLHPAKRQRRGGGCRRALLAGSLRETKDFLSRGCSEEEMRSGKFQGCADPNLLGSASWAREGDRNRQGDAAGAEAERIAAYNAELRTVRPDTRARAGALSRVKTAYLDLCGALSRGGGSSSSAAVDEASSASGRGAGDAAGGSALLALPGAGVRKDFELRQHREMVREQFERHGVDLDACVARQLQALEVLGLVPVDVGAVGRNERDEAIYNQCFYLSLARSYLESADQGALFDTALSLKRVTEAAVLAAHPDWAGERVGEDVQAFSDFLFFVLGSNALLSELAVAVFDCVSGGVEIYVGNEFPGRSREPEQRPRLLTIAYSPGHYQALLVENSEAAAVAAGAVDNGIARGCGGSNLPAARQRPSLRELRKALTTYGVQFVQTFV